jgi:hypothetical protein
MPAVLEREGWCCISRMQGCRALCPVLEAERSDIGKVKLWTPAKSSQTINKHQLTTNLLLPTSRLAKSLNLTVYDLIT